jgi:hypothetical protein
MEHALHLPNPKRSLAIPLAAAVLGAAVATTTYALTDGEQATPAKLVIVEPSGDHSPAGPTPFSGMRP